MNFLKPQHVVLRLTNSQVGDLETVLGERRAVLLLASVSKDSGASQADGNFSKQRLCDDETEGRTCFGVSFYFFESHFLLSSVPSPRRPSVGDSYKALKKSKVSAQIHKHENENMYAWKQSPHPPQVSSQRSASVARGLITIVPSDCVLFLIP